MYIEVKLPNTAHTGSVRAEIWTQSAAHKAHAFNENFMTFAPFHHTVVEIWLNKYDEDVEQ